MPEIRENYKTGPDANGNYICGFIMNDGTKYEMVKVSNSRFTVTTYNPTGGVVRTQNVNFGGSATTTSIMNDINNYMDSQFCTTVDSTSHPDYNSETPNIGQKVCTQYVRCRVYSITPWNAEFLVKDPRYGPITEADWGTSG